MSLLKDSIALSCPQTVIQILWCGFQASVVWGTHSPLYTHLPTSQTQSSFLPAWNSFSISECILRFLPSAFAIQLLECSLNHLSFG